MTRFYRGVLGFACLACAGNILAVSGKATPNHAEKVVCTNGNIFLVAADGGIRQLTGSGMDSDPILSPDGKQVVFVRGKPGRKSEDDFGEEDTNEIWMVDVECKEIKRIVQGRTAQESKETLVGLRMPAFSPDGKTLYFLSSAWATSDAIHRVRLDDLKVTFVAPGNTLEVVQTGEHKGCLIAQQHRYWIAGGSYDWYWLLTPDGEEVGPIGEENKMLNFHNIYGKEGVINAGSRH